MSTDLRQLYHPVACIYWRKLVITLQIPLSHNIFVIFIPRRISIVLIPLIIKSVIVLVRMMNENQLLNCVSLSVCEENLIKIMEWTISDLSGLYQWSPLDVTAKLNVPCPGLNFFSLFPCLGSGVRYLDHWGKESWIQRNRSWFVSSFPNLVLKTIFAHIEFVLAHFSIIWHALIR